MLHSASALCTLACLSSLLAPASSQADGKMHAFRFTSRAAGCVELVTLLLDRGARYPSLPIPGAKASPLQVRARVQQKQQTHRSHSPTHIRSQPVVVRLDQQVSVLALNRFAKVWWHALQRRMGGACCLSCTFLFLVPECALLAAPGCFIVFTTWHCTVHAKLLRPALSGRALRAVSVR